MMDNYVVFARHGGSKPFAFKVPSELSRHIKRDMMVVVETYKGLDIATTTTGVISGEGALDVAINAGAYEPLRSVVGIVPPILKSCILREELTKAINDNERSGKLPEFPF